MNSMLAFVYFFFLLILQTNGVDQERESSSIKIIRTRHGDIYDCVDFYKQPAFDHPLSANHTITFQRRPSLSHKKFTPEGLSMQRITLGLNDGGCPIGTVPIRRLTNEGLDMDRANAKNKHATTHYARCRAQEDTGYSGIAISVAIYRPGVVSGQHSAAKVKLQIGPDSIEAGWRVDPQLYGDNNSRFYIRTDVDPQLYGDNNSRFYIRTDARDSHCFNTLCPGFMITDKSIPLDLILTNVSHDGITYAFDMSITHDQPSGGNWILTAGTGKTQIGYWPNTLFSQPGLADYAEWGGEVFGAEGVINPGMGAGEILKESTKKAAYFSNIQVMNGPISGGQAVDPTKVNCDGDTDVYKTKNEGNVGGGLQYLTFYGGVPCYFC